MSTIKISELATSNISLSDFFVKSDLSGVANKNTIQELSNLLKTVDDTAFKGSIAIADVPTENGWFFASESGTYTNCGGLVIDTTDNIAIIIVSGTFDTFNKIDIPVNITIDTLPIDGSNNAVSSNGVYDAYQNNSLIDASNSVSDVIDFDSTTKILRIPAGTIIWTDNGQDILQTTVERTVDCTSSSQDLVKIVANVSTSDPTFSLKDSFGSGGTIAANERVFALIRKASSEVSIQCNYTVDGAAQGGGGGSVNDGTFEPTDNVLAATQKSTADFINADGIPNNVNDGIYTIEDASGVSTFKIYSDGVVDIAQIGNKLTSIINNLITEGTSGGTTPIALNTLTDINHIITYGQSLAVGQTSGLVTSTPENSQVLSFDDTVLTAPYTPNYPPTYTEFTAMREGNLRETPTSGTCYRAFQQISKNDGVNLSGKKFLGTAPGQGGKNITELSKGSDFYTRLLNDVNGGKALSDSLGLTYNVPVVTWTQGESDYISGTSKANYKILLLQLLADLDSDIKAITGQTNDVKIIMYQVATVHGTGTTYPAIALAQYELSNENDNLYLATPMYHVDYLDSYHITAESSRILGEHYGFCYSEVVEKGEWKPITPVAHRIDGNDIYLDFYVPTKPLVFEGIQSFVVPNQGFKVDKAATNILTSVSLESNGITVKLTCSESPIGSTVQYALDAYDNAFAKINVGFLRDSQGEDEKTIINAVTYRLDNWSPVFEYTL